MKDLRSFDLFFYASLIILAITYWIGMHLPILDIDSSQYALISKEMFNSGSYLEIYDKGANYLDKPPLVFWLACVSFKVFGVSDWAFRLPSVLCLALGIYSTYRFTKLFYDELTAKLAALIMAACCASFLMTLDVRTDTMLTGWEMFAMWQLAAFTINRKLKNIVLGAVGIGLAMLSKGPIGLIVPVVAFSFHFIYTRQWKSFFRYEYLLALVIIAIILLPMSYGLYEQYDMHPEATHDGMKNISGLRFFYWTQSFGRITGSSEWHNNPDPFFLLHSFLWSFLPWSALFIVALFDDIKEKIAGYKNNTPKEAIALGGFVLILFFLSRSNYQLPHYSFVIHPLAAVIAARYIGKHISEDVKSKTFSITMGVHIFLMFALYAGAFLILNFVFRVSILYSVLVALSLLAFIFILFYKKTQKENRFLLSTLIPFITLVLVLNLDFYPRLLHYQSGTVAVKDFNELAPANTPLLIYQDYAVNSVIFYCKAPVLEYIDDAKLRQRLVKGHTFIFAAASDVKTIQAVNPNIKVIKEYENYGITTLQKNFLNPATRNTTLDRNVLMAY